MSVISVLERLYQGHHKFEANLSHTVRPNLQSVKAETFLELDSGESRHHTLDIVSAISCVYLRLCELDPYF